VAWPRAKPASEADWSTEYLDAIISVRVVGGVDEAIDHIGRYGSQHTDAGVTADEAAAERLAPLHREAGDQAGPMTRIAEALGNRHRLVEPALRRAPMAEAGAVGTDRQQHPGQRGRVLQRPRAALGPAAERAGRDQRARDGPRQHPAVVVARLAAGEQVHPRGAVERPGRVGAGGAQAPRDLQDDGGAVAQPSGPPVPVGGSVADGGAHHDAVAAPYRSARLYNDDVPGAKERFHGVAGNLQCVNPFVAEIGKAHRLIGANREAAFIEEAIGAGARHADDGNGASRPARASREQGGEFVERGAGGFECAGDAFGGGPARFAVHGGAFGAVECGGVQAGFARQAGSGQTMLLGQRVDRRPNRFMG